MPKNVDVSAFEKSVAERLGMPAEVQFRYRSPYFRHIFGSDGYASGYYTYLWAEVLDADGFELFKQKGIFDPATAAAFKKYVLEAEALRIRWSFTRSSAAVSLAWRLCFATADCSRTMSLKRPM